LSIPAVRSQLVLEPAAKAFRIDVVVDRRSPQLYRAPEHTLDSRVETLAGGSTERAGRGAGCNPSLPERLAGVDIPESGNSTLIEEKDFDGSRSPSKQRSEAFAREFLGERFDADPGSPRFFRPDKAHPAELPAVREAEARLIGKSQEHRRVRLGVRSACRLYDQPPGHPEMNDERAPGAQRDDDVLATPPDRRDSLPTDLAHEPRRLRRDHFVEDHRDIGDRLSAYRDS